MVMTVAATMASNWSVVYGMFFCFFFLVDSKVQVVDKSIDPEKEKEEKIRNSEKLEKAKRRNTRRTGGGLVRDSLGYAACWPPLWEWDGTCCVELHILKGCVCVNHATYPGRSWWSHDSRFLGIRGQCAGHQRRIPVRGHHPCTAKVSECTPHVLLPIVVVRAS